MNSQDTARAQTPLSLRVTRRRALQSSAAAGLAAMKVGGAARFTGAQEASPVAAPEATPAGTAVGPDRLALVVERIPAIAREILAKSGVPGMSVAIVSVDAAAYVGGFGVLELGKTAPVDADSVFQLASLSKALAATVVSAVVGDGALSWDSRLAEIDPGFALHDAWPTQEVTLADLFSHRSGLPEHAGDRLEDLGFGQDEVIRRLRFLTPEYSFRGGYAYTNFGLSAAAYAAARAAGMSWADLSARRVYEPLAMTRTSSRFADYVAGANRAIPHVKAGGAWTVTPTQRDPDGQSPPALERATWPSGRDSSSDRARSTASG